MILVRRESHPSSKFIDMSIVSDFFRQFSALAWKNAVLKLRYSGTLFLEIFVPTVIILAIGGLSAAIPTNNYDQIIPTSYTPVPSFRLNDLYNVYNGQVLCQSYGDIIWDCSNQLKCEYVNGNVSTSLLEQLKKCQPKKIGVAPANPSDSGSVQATTDFVDYANSYYGGLPNMTTFVAFSSESSFTSYVKSPSYGVDNALPIYSAGIIFSSAYPNWDYSLRVNQTYILVRILLSESINLCKNYQCRRITRKDYHHLLLMFPLSISLYYQVIKLLPLELPI
jgi:hypothetical protein